MRASHLKVTVCQLHDEPQLLAEDWNNLVAHVRAQQSELILLPQMPFAPFFLGPDFDFAAWQAAISAHDAWEARFHELAPAVVLGSRPVDFGNERYHEAYTWEESEGIRGVHAQALVKRGE
ncbi:MAG TPA: hypothetical protein VKB34_23230, partial [Povalibacter sp.]|nr:hypothetical protein [Povalibacter sp.]